MNNATYLIRCITNLHVGSGDANYGVIDNEVQKDPVTGFPCIFSSSVKGALRDYFVENGLKEIEQIFGSDAQESNKGKKEGTKKGLLKFMQANILFLPARAITGSEVYYLATCKQALQDFNRYCQIVKGKDIIEGFADKVNGLKDDVCYAKDQKLRISSRKYTIEDSGLLSDLAKLFDLDVNKIAIVPNDDFVKITLPVLSRNYIPSDKATAQNLFYEEVVPHESVFYFGVLSTGTEQADASLEAFRSGMTDKAMIQFGGNASIGYGLCDVDLFKEVSHE